MPLEAWEPVHLQALTFPRREKSLRQKRRSLDQLRIGPQNSDDLQPVEAAAHSAAKDDGHTDAANDAVESGLSEFLGGSRNAEDEQLAANISCLPLSSDVQLIADDYVQEAGGVEWQAVTSDGHLDDMAGLSASFDGIDWQAWRAGQLAGKAADWYADHTEHLAGNVHV